MDAQLGPAVPVILLAMLGFLVANAIIIARGVDRGRIIGGNLLVSAWVVAMYWAASVPG